MRVYLAARYSRREEMERLADQLELQGHTITSRWVYDQPGDGRHIDDLLLFDPAFEGRRARIAAEDLADIDTAEVLVLFADPPRTPLRGGKHFEAGYAYARGKRVILVGSPENVFYCLPDVYQVYAEEALPELLYRMDQERSGWIDRKDAIVMVTTHPQPRTSS